jgi:hypothetical protein
MIPLEFTGKFTCADRLTLLDVGGILFESFGLRFSDATF